MFETSKRSRPRAGTAGEQVRTYRKLGFHFLAVGSDSALLRGGAIAALEVD